MLTNLGRWTCSIVSTVALAISIVAMSACNTVQPPNQQFSDARITTQVKTKLASDVRPSSLANIHVSTTNGIVTLSGAVESDAVKSKAELVTRSVSGVAKVNDELEIVPASAAR